MITAAQGRFANLGMAKKLGIGFFLVLLLTALVAAIGVWSLQVISHRFDGLKQMSRTCRVATAHHVVKRVDDSRAEDQRHDISR